MTITEFEHISLSLRPLLQSIGQQFFADGTRGDDVAQEILMRLWLIIRADVRLQCLVKRIYMDDIERQRQRQRKIGHLRDA
jgi:hypothetical protein